MEPALRIAIADDELDMRQYLQKVLSRMGHTVVSVAQTGQQLVEQCRMGRPDLIVTDVNMPEMDGIEAAVRICRQTPLPVILVSGHPDGRTDDGIGPDCLVAVLSKPITQSDLLTAIATAARQRERLGNAPVAAAQ
jgi:CheY-like chemotaxis protein